MFIRVYLPIFIEIECSRLISDSFGLIYPSLLNGLKKLFFVRNVNTGNILDSQVKNKDI